MQNGIEIYSGIFFPTYVMNVFFTDLNEIIHPQAENIPEYIRHYASAVFMNGSFWNDLNRLQDELNMDAHHSDYINQYISYIEMQRTTYRLVNNAEFDSIFIKIYYMH